MQDELSELPLDHQNKLGKVAEFYLYYQIALTQILESLPQEVLNDFSRSCSRASIALGHTEIWSCSDGVVLFVLNYMEAPSSNYINHVEIRNAHSQTMSELFNSRVDIIYTFTDPILKTSSKTPHATVKYATEDAKRSIIWIFNEGNPHNVLIPTTSKIALIGWAAVERLPPIDEVVTQHIQDALASLNIGSRTVATILIEEFERLLKSAKKEEELQSFLKDHPEFLYPTHIACHPKFKLGEEFITDYVLNVQATHGQEYVFVEIERADKNLFTTAGHFSAYTDSVF